jgi:hypothetical protein
LLVLFLRPANQHGFKFARKVPAQVRNIIGNAAKVKAIDNAKYPDHLNIDLNFIPTVVEINSLVEIYQSIFLFLNQHA